MRRKFRQANRADRRRNRLQRLPLGRRTRRLADIGMMIEDDENERIFPGDNEIEVGKTREVSTGAKRSELKGGDPVGDDEAEVVAAQKKSKVAAEED